MAVSPSVVYVREPTSLQCCGQRLQMSMGWFEEFQGMSDGPAYYTNWSPHPGPILWRDEAPALGVYLDRSYKIPPKGTAFPVGLMRERGQSIKVFRLAVEGVDPESLWILEDRRFIRLGFQGFRRGGPPLEELRTPTNNPCLCRGDPPDGIEGIGTFAIHNDGARLLREERPKGIRRFVGGGFLVSLDRQDQGDFG